MDQTLYDMIGGEPTVRALVNAFYMRVQAHPQLSKLFPEDITPVRNKQYRFLTQFLGGPSLYTQVYGHPMLRAKHIPHPVTPTRAKEWLSCMAEAMDEIGLEGQAREYIFERLTMTAHHMVNSEDEA